MTFTQMFEASDKLADVIMAGGAFAPHLAADIRANFVVIDRNDLPEIVPDADTSTGLRATVAYDAEGHVAEAYITPADQGYHSATPEWHEAKAKVHLAAAEYLRANPPVVVDEKAVDELQDALIGRNFVPRESARSLARSLVADGWKREVTS